jgi:S1-C subfamily serine protease
MKTARSIAILCLLVFPIVPFAIAQFTAKDHHKKGEELLKQNQLFAAYDEFRLAAVSDPSNSKYQKKLVEVGKLASRAAQREAQGFTTSDPAPYKEWLERAVRYDPTNDSAAHELASIRELIQSARSKAEETRQLLDKGEVQAAENLLSSLRLFKSAIPDLKDLEKEMLGVKTAREAETNLGRREYKLAMNEIAEAQREAPNCLFVLDVSKKVRRAESDNVLGDSEHYSSGSMSDLLHVLELTDYSLRVDGTNDRARETRQSASQQLADLVLGPKSGSGSGQSPSNPRVALERLNIAEPWIQQDSRFASTKTTLTSRAYPAALARIEIEGSGNCPNDINQDAIRKNILEGLGRVAKANREDWTLTFRVKSPSCSQTDVPRQSVQQVNSTYVAGYNQVANPVYAQLQQALSSAQIELTRAEINNQNNPNFATGFTLGLARGTVIRLQRQLAATQPYFQQEIVQQYQVEKFVALRSCHVESALQVYAKPGKKSFATEQSVAASAEDSHEGTAGVLPQDKSGLNNLQPVLFPLEQCNARASSEYLTKLKNGAKELAAGYFASAAVDRQLDANQRLASSMYVFDLAGGTQYEALRSNDAPKIRDASVEEEARTTSLLDSLDLPVLKQISFQNTDSSDTGPVENVLEHAMEGVVEIETDSGALGSGFFFTSACMVLTNHHVVEGAETIILRTSSRKLYTAQVLAKDDQRDLALLSTNAHTCSFLELEETEKPHVGQEVFAIGSPLGLSGTVTRGIVSAMRVTNSGIHYIQLDATINPGNSGGPLLSRSGKVLGINTFKLKGYEGLNFAVVSSEIRSSFGRFLK